MQAIEWTALSATDRRAVLARPSRRTRAEVTARVREIVAQVARDGDRALFELTERFDGVRLDSLRVSQSEFAAADAHIQYAERQAMERAIDNVQRFHAAQMPQPLTVDVMPGVRCEQLSRPIASVGLYVPAGSAPLPSTVIMLGVPSRIAGCRQRVLCTPPDASGNAHAAVLVAARLCGIDTVFKIGGAQAIAAMALGTPSVPKADKLFGPGNAWVTAAKQLVATEVGGVACDLPAGPSEVLVVADESARADFVAADLLAQAEHDPDSQVLLVASSRSLAEAALAEVCRQMTRLSRRPIVEAAIANSRCLVVPDVATAIDIANAYAPEHLILQVRDARRWLPAIEHAGSVFLGAFSPEPMGDYCSGTNHVLPTLGYSRSYGGLTVNAFLKSMTVQELSEDGLRALGPVAVRLARLEGLDAHAAAVTCRLEALPAAEPVPCPSRCAERSA